MKFFRTLKEKITTKASRFPKFLTNNFGRFRNSRKGIKPLNRPVRYKARSQTVTMRPLIPTCQRIENPIIDTQSLSVQAEINRIEAKETANKLAGIDNVGLDLSEIPPPQIESDT